MPLATLLFPIIALFQPAAPKIAVQLLAAHDAVQPGGQTELAVVVDVPAGWHVYHPVIVATGAPTIISFQAPAGVTFGELRYPSPTLGRSHDLEYLALDGRFVVLTTLQLDQNAPATPLTIVAHVRALLCQELCFPTSASASLTLNVTTATPTPVNGELFEQARDALPAPLGRAPHLEGGRVEVSPDTLTIGQGAELRLTVRVKKGHHIQDPDPGVEALIPSRLFIEPLNGLKFESPRWPDPIVKEIEGLGKVREQRGEFTVRVPFRIIDEQFPSGPVSLRVLLTYQVCSDAGMCYPPQTAEGLARFTARTPNAEAPTPLGTLVPRIGAPTEEWSGPQTGDSQPTAAGEAISLTAILFFGLLGGLILNVMPCVFPVISIKILSFVHQAGEQRGRVFRLGLAFCAGILVWFWIFAFLTSLGQVPWQHPPVVIGLSAVVFVFALNLFGVFEIVLPGAAAGALDEMAGREGYLGAFLKGLLATLLGTACTAPFFATAAAFAATQPRHVAFAVFTSAGVGMAAPYVLLSAFPGWLKALPKPGPWMVVFKQVMGFVLVGTSVWLLLIVGDLLNARGVVWTVAFWTFLGFGAWLVGKISFNWTTAARATAWVAAIAVAVFGWWFSFRLMYDWQAAGRAAETAETSPEAVAAAVGAASWDDHVPWQRWQPGLAEELARRGYTVFVDFTATWCITCQTNKATAIEIDATRRKMQQLGVIPLRADYTSPNPIIRQVLLAHGHNSVPLNLIYPAGRPQDVRRLPSLLTPGILAEALDQAGPTQPASSRARAQ